MNIDRIADAIASGSTPVVRTDFTDNDAWTSVLAAISAATLDTGDPEDEDYEPDLVVIDDKTHAGLSAGHLAAMPVESGGGYAILVDSQSILEAAGGAAITVTYVDLSVIDPEDAELFDSFMGRSFRVVVPEVPGIEANLSISNMDFSDFANAVAADGVFRGFDDEPA